jgi:hypothetical protein
MAEQQNPKVVKSANGLYTVREYEQPKEVPTSDLRKVADATRKVQIRIPYDHPVKQD